MLDEIDKILVSELQKNGRTALSHISKKIGISHAAVEARLGEPGLNRLLITPEFGPRVRLSSILTAAPLQTDKKF